MPPLEIVLTGETSEVVAHFKEMSDIITRTEAKYKEFAAKAQEEYDALLAAHPDRKGFCMNAQKSLISKHLINVYLGRRPNMDAEFRASDVRVVAEHLGGLTGLVA